MNETNSNSFTGNDFSPGASSGHTNYTHSQYTYAGTYYNGDWNGGGVLFRMIWDFLYEKWNTYWQPPLPAINVVSEPLKRQPKPEALVDLMPQNQTIKKAAVAPADPQIGFADDNDNVSTSKVETTAGDILSLESRVMVNGFKTLEGMDNGILSADNTTVRYHTHNQTSSYQSPAPVDGAYPLDANTAAVVSGNTVTPVNMTNITKSYYSRFFSQVPSQIVRDPFSQTQTVISGNRVDEYDTVQLVQEKPSAPPQANNIAVLPDGKIAAASDNGLEIVSVDAQGNFNLINSVTTGPLKGCIVSGNGIYTIESSRNILRFDATTYQQTSNVTVPGPVNDLVVANVDSLWATGNNVIYECSNVSNPIYSRSISVPGEGSINKAENSNGVVYLATANGCRLIHEAGALLGRVNIAGGASGVAYSSNFPNYTWVAGKTAGVVCVDIQNTLAPTIVSTLPMPGMVSGIAIPPNGNNAKVTTDRGVFNVNISDPKNMTMSTGTFASNVKNPVIANSKVYTAGSVEEFDLNTEPKRTETLSLPPKQILHSLTHTYRLYDRYIEVIDKVTRANVGTWNSPYNLTRMKWINDGQNNQLAAGHDGGIVVLDVQNSADIKALQNIRCGGKLEDFAIFKNNVYLSNSSDCNKTTPDPGNTQTNLIIQPDGTLNINITDANGLPTNIFDNLPLELKISGGQLINATTGLPLPANSSITASQANMNQIKLAPGTNIIGATGNDGGIQVELHPVVKKFDPVFNSPDSPKLPLGIIIGVTVGGVASAAAFAIAWYVRVQKKLGEFQYNYTTRQQCNLFWCGANPDEEEKDDQYHKMHQPSVST